MELHFFDQGLTSDDMSNVCNTITTKPVTWLNMGVNKIGDEGVRHITTAITSGSCNLTKLWLSGNRIGDCGAHHIATAIESGYCKLTHLYLTRNEIGDCGARHIATAIESGKCKLTQLYLTLNRIGDCGARHIGAAIESGKCSLTILEWNANVMSDGLGQVIPLAVHHRRSLRVVVIEYVTSRRLPCHELRELLLLSAHCRWPQVVELILSLLIDSFQTFR